VGLVQRELVSCLHHILDQFQPHVELDACSGGVFFEGYSTKNVVFCWKKNYNGEGFLRKLEMEETWSLLMRRGRRKRRGEARMKKNERSSLQRKRDL
jgi:hypothetical protein